MIVARGTARPGRTLWIVLGVVAAFLLCLVVAIYLWWQRAGSPLLEEAVHSYERGHALGRRLTATACIDTLFSRLEVDSVESMRREIDQRAYTDGCLAASTPSPGLCDTIPAQSNIKAMMRFAAWSVEQCRIRGVKGQGCPRMLNGLQRYCSLRSSGGGGPSPPGDGVHADSR